MSALASEKNLSIESNIANALKNFNIFVSVNL